MDGQRNKVLVLASQSKANATAIDALRATCDVVEIPTIDEAIEALRRDHFSAIFSDSADFLPLERALVSQQANLVLNTIGEGVCIVDSEGRSNWMKVGGVGEDRAEVIPAEGFDRLVNGGNL
ncbi:MAG: hypothetical protein JWP03_1917, partial [Phycisphaerales bacterium]|nr:hypothetical protein [Phycisphaerales bacterium]